MKFNVARFFDWEGYRFDEYNTDDLTADRMNRLAYELANGDVDLIEYVEPTPKRVGKKLFEAIMRERKLLETSKQKRSQASKKGWKNRKVKGK